MEQKRIEMLYELLEMLEKQGDTEHASAVMWAIFQLENKI